VLQIIRLVNSSLKRERDYVHSYCSNNMKIRDKKIHSILIVILYTFKKRENKINYTRTQLIRQQLVKGFLKRLRHTFLLSSSLYLQS